MHAAGGPRVPGTRTNKKSDRFAPIDGARRKGLDSLFNSRLRPGNTVAGQDRTTVRQGGRGKMDTTLPRTGAYKGCLTWNTIRDTMNDMGMTQTRNKAWEPSCLARRIAESPSAPALWPPLHDPDRGKSGHPVTVSPEYGQLPQAPELKLCIARTGGLFRLGVRQSATSAPTRSSP